MAEGQGSDCGQVAVLKKRIRIKYTRSRVTMRKEAEQQKTY